MHMKSRKKELVTNISETIQDKLKGSVGEGEKLKKAIKKIARKLAEKVVKISVKQEKNLKKVKEKAEPALKNEDKEVKKHKSKNGLKNVDMTEREYLSEKKPSKEKKEK